MDLISHSNFFYGFFLFLYFFESKSIFFLRKSLLLLLFIFFSYIHNGKVVDPILKILFLFSFLFLYIQFFIQQWHKKKEDFFCVFTCKSIEFWIVAAICIIFTIFPFDCGKEMRRFSYFFMFLSTEGIGWLHVAHFN